MIRLDETDARLLALLRKNSRAPYSILAKELGLSESAVRKRIKRLVKAGIIKRFTIEYDMPGEIGAIILVKIQPPTPIPKILPRILSYHMIDRVMEVTGEYDIVAIARAQRVEDINELIDYIRSIDGVQATYTMIILRSH